MDKSNTNRKILIIAPYFYPHKGGLEQFCFEIATRLAKKNLDVTVLTSNIPQSKDKEKIFGINIIRLDHYNLINGRWPMPKVSVKKYLDEIKPDIIITNTRFFPICYSAYKYARSNNIKLIHIEHGTSVSKLGRWLSNSLADLYDKVYGNKIIKNANLIIGISDAASHFSKTLGAKNPITIHNSVDTNFFKPSDLPSEARRAKDGSPHITHYPLQVTYIGRLIEAKGIQDLISAFKNLENKNLILNIVGIGFFESELKKLAKNDRRIKFLGEKNQAEIKQILSETDVLVNPSYGEGLPTSVLEAGAMGLSIIATDVGGTREIIDNDKNGFLIQPKKPDIIKSRLEKLIKSDILRRSFSKKIREKIENDFGWNKNIDKLYSEIRDL